MGKAGLFPGVKRQKGEVEPSPPTRAQIKNESSYTSSPSQCGEEELHLTFVFHISLLQTPSNNEDKTISNFKGYEFLTS